MYEFGIRIGAFLLGGLFGLSGALFYVRGLSDGRRIESGQKLFGKVKPLEPVVNTDREFVDEIRQDRYEQGLDPYLNES